MKKRLRLLTSLLAIGCSQTLYGLGLGGITVESALNEPLEAKIELLNVDDLTEQDLIIAIGSPEDYQIAGVEREYFHTSMVLEPRIAGTAGSPYISVATSAPVREPYLNFVIQVRWPQGKLLREYTLLLDLPVFTGRTETAPINRAQVSPASSQAASASRSPASSQPPLASVRSGIQYRVQNGDTLWSLAGRVASESGVTRHQAMLAIRDVNPEAFVNGDPNTLRAGVLIRIPDESRAVQRSASQAIEEFNAIQQRRTASTLEATPVRSASNNFRTQASGGTEASGRLALASSAALGLGAASSQGTEADAQLNALAGENETLKEELDRTTLENTDLRERVAALEEQLEIARAIVELESNQLANMQEGLTQSAQEEASMQVASGGSAPDELAVEAETAPEPVSASVLVQEEAAPQPSLVDSIIGYVPYFGVLVVLAVLVVMLIMKRRRAAEDDDIFSDELEEHEEEEEVEVAEESPEEAMDQTASFAAEGQEEDEAGFESMDELFAIESNEEQVEPEIAEVDETEVEQELEDVPDEDVEDIDLESALEDLDEFADLDSFLDEDIEDFDLESDEGLEDIEESKTDTEEATESETSNEMDFESIELSEPGTEDEDEDEQGPAGNEMDFDTTALELPETEEEQEAPSGDDANSMDFDISDLDPAGVADEEEESPEPAGNEMEFDSEDFDLPGEIVDEEPKEDLHDEAHSMDFDDEIELPEVEEEHEPSSGEQDENAMEFDIDDLELPEVENKSELPEVDEFPDELELPEAEEGFEAEAPEIEEQLDQVEEDIDELSADLQGDMDELLASLEDEGPEAEEAVAETDILETEPEDDEFDLGMDIDLDEGMDLEEDLLAGLGDEGGSDLLEEMSTKLELADAYIEMGDVRGAKELIDEILADGDDNQKAEAKKLSERIEGLT